MQQLRPVTRLRSAVCRAGGLLVALVLLLPAAADETTRDRRRLLLGERRAEIFDSLKSELVATREWAFQRGLTDEAAEIDRQLNAAGPLYSSSELPALLRADASAQLPPVESLFQQRMIRIRSEHASRLYTLARSALRSDFPSLAFSMVEEVVRIDPDHRLGRSILGDEVFVDPARRGEPGYNGEWVSAFEKRMRSGRSPHVDHPRFGWIPDSAVDRYEEGLRPWRGDWISEGREQELRRDFRSAWEIPSENFLVRTNVGLEEGVQLSRRLELFHAWFRQHFAAFFETPAELEDRFERTVRSSRSSRPRPLEVHYFASRAEYQEKMRGKLPPGIDTNGLYWQPDRTCYFFDNPESSDYSTMYHEATHQILDVATADARRTAARALAAKFRQRTVKEWTLCSKSNFWIIEGLACYFESFAVGESGEISIGDPAWVRFDTARQRLLDPAFHFYLPAEQFFGLGMNEFQQHPQISPLYSQASGFAHFLMHYEDGVYRDQLIELLAAIYRPDPKNVLAQPSFNRITGVRWQTLDQQYHEHMRNLEDQLRARAAKSRQQSSLIPEP
ncbi:MAG: hypothetical protein ACPGXX_14320 [Planctomycetaceae bacterium]